MWVGNVTEGSRVSKRLMEASFVFSFVVATSPTFNLILSVAFFGEKVGLSKVAVSLISQIDR